MEEQLVREDQEMENVDYFLETIHMVYRELKYLHNC
jgi:hypothetical protein